jgi:hypothetical protein
VSLRVFVLLSMITLAQACVSATGRTSFGGERGPDRSRQTSASVLRRLGPTVYRAGAVMLVPSAVEPMVSLAGNARPRLLVGAIFASGVGPESEEGSLALIFEAPEGGLAEALQGSSMRIAVDEDWVFDSSIAASSLLVSEPSTGESLVLPVSVGLLGRITKGSFVRVWMGKAGHFDLEASHLEGFRALLGEIPQGIRLTHPRPVGAVPLTAAD